MRLPFSRLAVGIALVVAVASLMFAGRFGSSVGKSSDSADSALPTKTCPTGTPNACLGLFADVSHADAADLPTIAAATPGLAYADGQVITPKDGTTPILELAFHSTSPLRTFHLLVRQRPVPKTDVRAIRTTAGGHKYRAVRGNVGMVGLSFFDEHFSYLVVDDQTAVIAKTDGSLALAERLIDAISPATHRLDPA